MSSSRVGWVMGICLVLALAGGCDRGAAERGGQAASALPEPKALDAQLVANLPPGTGRDAAETGHRLFPTCAVCHGADGSGTQLGPSLRDQEWIGITGTTEEIERVIREGVSEPREYPVPMPVMGGGSYSDEEVAALTAYVYALSRTPAAAEAPAPAAR